MGANAVTPFLPTAEQVAQAVQTSSGFRDFLSLALKSSGLDPRAVDFTQVRYRIADATNGARDDLRHDGVVLVNGCDTPIHELLAVHRDVRRDYLIHALWALAGFDQLKQFLRSLRTVVRYARDVKGDVYGHILLADSIIPMIESVERREYVLPNGDMASDAITRNLGLRAKVFALDRERRPEQTEDTNIFDRLSRTLGRINSR